MYLMNPNINCYKAYPIARTQSHLYTVQTFKTPAFAQVPVIWSKPIWDLRLGSHSVLLLGEAWSF